MRTHSTSLKSIRIAGDRGYGLCAPVPGNYLEEQKRCRRERATVGKRRADIEAAKIRLITALEKGTIPEDLIHGRLQAPEAERVQLTERQWTAEEQLHAVGLHPQAIAACRQAVENLRKELTRPGGLTADREAFRNLVDHILIKPTPKRASYEIAIVRRLAALLGVDVRRSQRAPQEIMAESGSCATPDLALSKWEE